MDASTTEEQREGSSHARARKRWTGTTTRAGEGNHACIVHSASSTNLGPVKRMRIDHVKRSPGTNTGKDQTTCSPNQALKFEFHLTRDIIISPGPSIARVYSIWLRHARITQTKDQRRCAPAGCRPNKIPPERASSTFPVSLPLPCSLLRPASCRAQRTTKDSFCRSFSGKDRSRPVFEE